MRYGLDRFVNGLNKHIARLERNTQAGITAAALFLRGEAQKRCPIDTGNLRASAYTVSKGGMPKRSGSFSRKKKNAKQTAKVIKSTEQAMQRSKVSVDREDGPAADVGFGAFYAVYVHEINKNYKQGGWKYLQRAIVENRARIINIIRDRARRR